MGAPSTHILQVGIDTEGSHNVGSPTNDEFEQGYVDPKEERAFVSFRASKVAVITDTLSYGAWTCGSSRLDSLGICSSTSIRRILYVFPTNSYLHLTKVLRQMPTCPA